MAVSGREEEDMATSSCWAAQMQRLQAGVNLPTPEGPKRFVGGMAILAADTPAAAEMTGAKKAVGPKTKSICRNCHCAQHGNPPPFKAANSFLASLPGWKVHCNDRCCKYTLRSRADLQAYVSKMLELRAGKIKRADVASWLQEQGINSFQPALRRCPLWSSFVGAPMDAMHVVLEGVSRNLLGALWYFMLREWGVAEDTLLAAIASHAKLKSCKKGYFPYLNPSRREVLRGGTSDNLPHSDCAFPGTAAQIMHLVLDSVEIFHPHLPQEALQSCVWQCFVQHVLATRIAMQRSFRMADLVALDKHIWMQDTLMLLSPKLKHLWKPKNHYFSHLPLEILQWGPPRLYWCMLFEHENQFFKGAASHSNFANVLWSCANAKARATALELMHKSPETTTPAEDSEEYEQWMAQEVFRYGVEMGVV